MARDERFGIGKRVDDLQLLVLEQLREATYTAPAAKTILLGKTLKNIDLLRFLFGFSTELASTFQPPLSAFQSARTAQLCVIGRQCAEMTLMGDECPSELGDLL